MMGVEKASKKTRLYCSKVPWLYQIILNSLDVMVFGDFGLLTLVNPTIKQTKSKIKTWRFDKICLGEFRSIKILSGLYSIFKVTRKIHFPR